MWAAALAIRRKLGSGGFHQFFLMAIAIFFHVSTALPGSETWVKVLTTCMLTRYRSSFFSWFKANKM
jgi:hypothetical protein